MNHNKEVANRIRELRRRAGDLEQQDSLAINGDDVYVFGQLGIGTTSPGEVLEINGGTDTRLVIGTGLNAAGTITAIEFKGRYGVTFADGEIFGAIEVHRPAGGGFGDMIFKTKGGTGSHATESMRINNSGDVGIGTDSPAAKLDVSGAIRSTNYAAPASGVGMEMYYTGGNGYLTAYNRGTAAYIPLVMQGSKMFMLTGNVQVGGVATDTPARQLVVKNSGDAWLSLLTGGTTNYTGVLFGDSDSDSRGQVRYKHSTDTMEFRVAGAEKMQIDSSGRVGIGGAPAYDLDVRGSSAQTIRIYGDYLGGQALLRYQNDVQEWLTYLNSSDQFIIRDVTAANNVVVVEPGAAANSIRIDSSGHLGIGTGSPSYVLDVQGDTATHLMKLFNDGNAATRYGIDIQAGQDSNPTTFYIQFRNGAGSTVGYIKGDGSGGVNYFSASDESIKEDIQTLSNSLDVIKELRPVSYRGKGSPPSHARAIGLVAQEVRAVVPEVVSKADDGLLGIDYSRLTPVLIAAINELAAKVEALESA